MKTLLKIYEISCGNCKDKIELLLHMENPNLFYCKTKNSILDVSISIKESDYPLIEDYINSRNWSNFKNYFNQITGFICKYCENPYCKNCWSEYKTHREDDYDIYSTAKCPKGHDCLIDQLL